MYRNGASGSRPVARGVLARGSRAVVRGLWRVCTYTWPVVPGQRFPARWPWCVVRGASARSVARGACVLAPGPGGESRRAFWG